MERGASDMLPGTATVYVELQTSSIKDTELRQCDDNYIMYLGTTVQRHTHGRETTDVHRTLKHISVSEGTRTP